MLRDFEINKNKMDARKGAVSAEYCVFRCFSFFSLSCLLVAVAWQGAVFL